MAPQIFLIVGTPRGRLRSALGRAAREQLLSLEGYLKLEKELPTLESGQWNLAHADAIKWDELLADLAERDGPIVIVDDRTTGCKALLDMAHRILVCSATESGCFSDCILSRVTLQDYSLRIWPTYLQRAKSFWASLDNTLRAKISVLDEEEYRKRERSAVEQSAAEQLAQLLGPGLPPVTNLGQWSQRCSDAPQRNQRKFQQVRKDVLYSFEMEARSFATRVTNQLTSGSLQEAEKALKDVEAYRLSIPAMKPEERAKWSSVLCTREAGRNGEILSVELLRWAWARLKQAGPGRAVEHSQILASAAELAELECELIPFAQLLKDSSLQSICSAVDAVLGFGRLFFLRQRMWDAEPVATRELAQLLLEHQHWVLRCLGLRLTAQLLDADAPRYQLSFRDLQCRFGALLARALLHVAGPALEDHEPEEWYQEGEAVEALWHGAWHSASFAKYGQSKLGVRYEAEGELHWRPEGWVRRPRQGTDYWRCLSQWHLCDGSALRKLLNRAPEHCLHVIEEPALVAGLRQLLRGRCLALAAEAAGALLRLMRYGPTSAGIRGELPVVEHLVARLAEEGPSEALSEATGYLSALAWSKQWHAAAEVAEAEVAEVEVEEVSEVEALAKEQFVEVEDPAERVLELRELQRRCEEECCLRLAAEDTARESAAALRAARESAARLLDEKKDLLQRIMDLERDRARSTCPAPPVRLEPAEPAEPAEPGDDEENDWALTADPEALSVSEAKDFVERLARRRDAVRLLRRSLCGGLRQLGERLYTSPVHFIDELLQNADDCSYSQEPSFRLEVTATSAVFSYNERGFRARDVLSLCSLAVSTKSGEEFLGHKGVGFKSVFACSDCPAVVSGKFRFQFLTPGTDELSYITPRWLEEVPAAAKGQGTHILLPFRSELVGSQEFRKQLKEAVDPLVLLGLRRLRCLNFEMEEVQLKARLSKCPAEDFMDVSTWRACLRINEAEHLFRVFAKDDVVLAFPTPPGAELPVCAGLPCARLGYRFLLQANWQLTTSREAVRESVENYKLRSEAATLFGLAAQHPEIVPHLAIFLPSGGSGTPCFWQSFVDEALNEVRKLPGLSGEMRLPEEKVLSLVPAEVFLNVGLQVVEDELAQAVLKKLGIPHLTVTDIFSCLPLVREDAWWEEFFSLLEKKVDAVEAWKQPIWRLRGRAGRGSLPPSAVIYFSAPADLSAWRDEVALLDPVGPAERRYASLVATLWDAGHLTRQVLDLHLQLRREEVSSESLWRDLAVLKDHGDLQVVDIPGEMALVPTLQGPMRACLTTLPTVLGCPIPASGLKVAFQSNLSVPEAISWEFFLLQLGCQPPLADMRRSTTSTWLLPPLEELHLPLKLLEALPARTLQWLRENLHMAAHSGSLVSLGALVSESALRHLAQGLEVVSVPLEMQEAASLLGICIRPDAEMCWLSLRSLCESGVKSLGPYLENLAMLQSLRRHGEVHLPEAYKSQEVLYLPDAADFFWAPENVYYEVVEEPGFEELCGLLKRGVVDARRNAAYVAFQSELSCLGCRQLTVMDCEEALQRAAQDPSLRHRLGPSSILGRGELLNDRGLEIMLRLYRLLERTLGSKQWTWEDRLRGEVQAKLTRPNELPVVNWEGRLISGVAEVWACRSSWFLDTVLSSTELCFVHREVAEYCPHLVASQGWKYLEGWSTVLWQQSNNNPEKELSEVSEAFSQVLNRPLTVISCNWIALELIFSPKVEVHEEDWFSEIPDLLRERVRAQPAYAAIGQGVLVLASHFVKEAAERAALAAAALTALLRQEGREDAEALARSTCEEIRAFASERFWESEMTRQVRGTEVLLPGGLGEEVALPGLIGSFGQVEQYDDEPRLIPSLRRDHELFEGALGRILAGEQQASGRSQHVVADAAALKEQQKRVGERAEHFYSCFLERVLGESYKPTRDWLSSARLLVHPGSRETDDACGCDFVVWDTAQRIVRSPRPTRCFIEVKGCAQGFAGSFCLSANEQRKRDQVAASEGKAYVIAVVDHMEDLEQASIRHFHWGEASLLRLEADSYVAHVDLRRGELVGAREREPRKFREPRERDGATVAVPANAVGLVIGKGGATVKWIMSESGASVQVAEQSTSGLAHLKIQGNKDQIHWAKQLIQEVVYGREGRSGRVWKGSAWQ